MAGKWAHSPKQHDYAGTVVSVILNWARDAGLIQMHHCDRLPKIYKNDRSDIIWASSDIEAFNKKAPEWVRHILSVACETGLRPGDLIRLNWANVEEPPQGRRIKMRTNKRGQFASIPVTEKLALILNATPKNRLLILVSHTGLRLTEHRASEAVRQ